MRIRKIPTKWGIALPLLLSDTAYAQPTIGSVTTAPASLAAPILGDIALVVLFGVLVAAGWNTLRPRNRALRVGAGLALALVISMPITRVFANANIVVTGEECGRVNTETFDLSGGEKMLLSDCPNVIRIIALTECNGLDPMTPAINPATPTFPPCEVGLTLAPGASCKLPLCSPG